MESIDELQTVERECIARFRAKAAQIKEAHPELTSQICTARAIQALPRTADRYMGVRQRLMFAGYPAMPLR